MMRNLLIASIILIVMSGISSAVKREMTLAGTWYPAGSTETSKVIDALMLKVPDKKPEGELLALIVPHAGWDFSAGVAAYGYKALLGEKFDTIVLVGQSHKPDYEGISVGNFTSFDTPLGQIPADRELIQKLLNYDKRFIFAPQAHQKENSTEVQFPFLKKVCGEAKLVEILVGIPSQDNLALLVRALDELTAGRKVLFIASSDMSHYYTYDQAVIMDQLALGAIEENDLPLFSQLISSGKSEFCGLSAVLSVIMLANDRGANYIKVLDYANSGDVTGDKSRVVGYSAVGFYSKKTMLNEKQKRKLLKIARETLDAYLKTGKMPQLEETDADLKVPMGAFVTLTKAGQLRGCIGYIRPVKPLFETIAEMAVAAAVDDNRFPPVTRDELKDLKIEISVLSKLEPVKDLNEIIVGKHGLVIQNGAASGLLLPQVPGEFGWDRDQFLENLCYKAGLPLSALTDKATRIYSFTADVFHE